MTKFFYRVGEGDTIISISKKFSISPVKIIKLNRLKKEVEQGDLLYLEQKDSKTKTYVVQPFDNLDSVAKKFSLDKSQIIKRNGVDYLFYGLIIEI